MPKLLRVSLGLQITRAPPWCFLSKNQSRLVPPLRPPAVVVVVFAVIIWGGVRGRCLGCRSHTALTAVAADDPMPVHAVGNGNPPRGQ
jgi:hypothetical protein